MTSGADFSGIQECIDAEIARTRLEDLIAECCDADVMWLSDVVQEAFIQAALAARAEVRPPARTPQSVRDAPRNLSFKD